MSEVIKIKEDYLEQMKKIQEDYNKKTFEFGRLMQAKIEIDKQFVEWEETRHKLEKEYDDLQGRESTLAEILEKEYGIGQVNLETGEFTK